jgi:hypothetical protein
MTPAHPVGGTLSGIRAARPAGSVRGVHMTDIGASRPDVDTTRPAYSRGPEPTAWTGWVVFAAFMMIMVGGFQLIEGFVAIFDKGFYAVARSGQVFKVDYSVWGWFHVLLGAVLLISGLGVLAGNLAARVLGVFLAGLSALANLLFIAAYPFWSLTIIAVDVLVIYALTVHGRELRDAG